MTDIKNKFAVVVVSCDKYSDLWKPFFQLFGRFWLDCPFNVYLLSNEVIANIPRVKNLLIGEDISWSDNLIKGVSQLKEKNIFLVLDDLFLFDFVNSQKILEVFDWIIKSKANYVRLNPFPRPDRQYNKLVGVVSKGTIYRTSTVSSVWKKDVLLNLLKPGESAWDFEVYGTVRSNSYDGFYSTWENHFPIINTVIKSKWQRKAVKKITSLGIDIDLTVREVMTPLETIVFYFGRMRSKLLKLFPAKYRGGIKDFVLRGRYNYKSTLSK
ncbi:MAG: hypothetical protein QME81_06460 [bacterium]|nr:hypothetical protein [bacterium]